MIARGQQERQALKMRRDVFIGLGRIGGAESGQDGGIDAVGFGQDVAGAGEVADLAWIDDTEGDGFGVEGGDRLVLAAAGGFAKDMDALIRKGTQPQTELGEAGRIVGDREDEVGDAAVDGGFGEVGSEIEGGCGFWRWIMEVFGLGLALPY